MGGENSKQGSYNGQYGMAGYGDAGIGDIN